MSSVRTRLRHLVERSPRIARLYLALRDEIQAGETKYEATSFGFRFGGSAAVASGRFEQDETAFLNTELQKAQVFLDIGANVGFYSCLARSMNKTVLSFEPMTENLRFLLRNLDVNGWHDVEVFPLGLSDRPGILALFGRNTGASIVPGWAGAAENYSTLVPVSTLDLVVGSRFAGQPLLVKIDVEGAERLVLEGAVVLLTMSPPPVLMVEVLLTAHHPNGFNPNFGPVFDLFWSHGFSAFSLPELRLIGRDTVDRWVAARGQDFGSSNFVFRK